MRSSFSPVVKRVFRFTPFHRGFDVSPIPGGFEILSKFRFSFISVLYFKVREKQIALTTAIKPLTFNRYRENNFIKLSITPKIALYNLPLVKFISRRIITRDHSREQELHYPEKILEKF
jgi:hypothetical protein